MSRECLRNIRVSALRPMNAERWSVTHVANATSCAHVERLPIAHHAGVDIYLVRSKYFAGFVGGLLIHHIFIYQVVFQLGESRVTPEHESGSHSTIH